MVLAGIAAVIVAAAVAFPRRPIAPAEVPNEPTAAGRDPMAGVAPDPQPIASPPSVATVAAAPLPVDAPPVVPSKVASEPTKKAPARTAAPRTATSPSSSTAVPAPVAVSDPSDSRAPATALAEPEPPQGDSASTAVTATPSVTITGCLEISVDQEEFRLTDTDGAQAPKSRSWRSGFLRKRSAAVTLVDPPDRLQMKSHVGRRVAAVGLLAGQELKVSSVRVLDSACD